MGRHIIPDTDFRPHMATFMKMKQSGDKKIADRWIEVHKLALDTPPSKESVRAKVHGTIDATLQAYFERHVGRPITGLNFDIEIDLGSDKKTLIFTPDNYLYRLLRGRKLKKFAKTISIAMRPSVEELYSKIEYDNKRQNINTLLRHVSVELARALVDKRVVRLSPEQIHCKCR